MAIGYIKRLAGPYIGDGTGQKTFSFGFFVFTEGDVYVATAATENGASSTLQQGTDYTVTLNADQEASPGGTITLTAEAGLADGTVLVIGSDVDYTQTLDLTNYTRFPPARISEELDRIVVQIQQLVEILGRTVKVDATDTMTPEELKQQLLDAANTATIVAKGYAEAAAASAADAKQSRDDILDHKQGIVDAVTAEGDKQNQRLVTEGDTQIGRIQAETDNTLIANGMGCAERFWTLSADTPAGTDITIPSGIKYLVNRHHLRVAWNGLVLAIGQNFTEVGAEDTFSSTFRLTFDAKAGDEIDVWIGALGKGDVAEALALAGEASAAVAELSRKVVYKEEV